MTLLLKLTPGMLRIFEEVAGIDQGKAVATVRLNQREAPVFAAIDTAPSNLSPEEIHALSASPVSDQPEAIPSVAETLRRQAEKRRRELESVKKVISELRMFNIDQLLPQTTYKTFEEYFNEKLEVTLGSKATSVNSTIQYYYPGLLKFAPHEVLAAMLNVESYIGRLPNIGKNTVGKISKQFQTDYPQLVNFLRDKKLLVS